MSIIKSDRIVLCTINRLPQRQSYGDTNLKSGLINGGRSDELWSWPENVKPKSKRCNAYILMETPYNINLSCIHSLFYNRH